MKVIKDQLRRAAEHCGQIAGTKEPGDYQVIVQLLKDGDTITYFAKEFTIKTEKRKNKCQPPKKRNL